MLNPIDYGLVFWDEVPTTGKYKSIRREIRKFFRNLDFEIIESSDLGLPDAIKINSESFEIETSFWDSENDCCYFLSISKIEEVSSGEWIKYSGEPWMIELGNYLYEKFSPAIITNGIGGAPQQISGLFSRYLILGNSCFAFWLNEKLTGGLKLLAEGKPPGNHESFEYLAKGSRYRHVDWCSSLDGGRFSFDLNPPWNFKAGIWENYFNSFSTSNFLYCLSSGFEINELWESVKKIVSEKIMGLEFCFAPEPVKQTQLIQDIARFYDSNFQFNHLPWIDEFGREILLKNDIASLTESDFAALGLGFSDKILLKCKYGYLTLFGRNFISGNFPAKVLEVNFHFTLVSEDENADILSFGLILKELLPLIRVVCSNVDFSYVPAEQLNEVFNTAEGKIFDLSFV